jgi:hypothetical protein
VGRVYSGTHRQFERASCWSDTFVGDGDVWLQAIAELHHAWVMLLRRLFGGTQRLAPAATIAALRHGSRPHGLSPIVAPAMC